LVHTRPAPCAEALRRAPSSAKVQTPAILRILSWNTMKYAREGSRDVLAHFGARADFLALQEGLEDGEAVSPDLPHRYFAPGYVAGERQTGVELHARTAATDVCYLSFREPWLRTPKAVLASRHAYADRTVLVVTLHAINFTIGVADYRDQFGTVGRLLRAHGGPAIVIGDFNNWNGARQKVLEAFARDHDLSIASFEPDWRSRHFGRPVDGLLQRGFTYVSVTAIPTRASDHHPILALLRPRPTPGADSPAAGDAPGPGP